MLRLLQLRDVLQHIPRALSHPCTQILATTSSLQHAVERTTLVSHLPSCPNAAEPQASTSSRDLAAVNAFNKSSQLPLHGRSMWTNSHVAPLQISPHSSMVRQILQLSSVDLRANSSPQRFPANSFLNGGQQVRHLLMMPRRTKYRRAHKKLQYDGPVKPNTYQLSYGMYGIRATSPGIIRAATLEALRRTLRRKIKKSSKMWILVNASIPVTRKPAEVRMGKGKGAVKFWATRVRPGQIIFEMDRLPRPLALAAVESIRHKIPVKVGFVEWN